MQEIFHHIYYLSKPKKWRKSGSLMLIKQIGFHVQNKMQNNTTTKHTEVTNERYVYSNRRR